MSVAGGSVRGMLTTRETMALEMADRLYLSAGLRDQAIKWELGWTPTRSRPQRVARASALTTEGP